MTRTEPIALGTTPDALAAVGALARSASAPYLVYERDGRWHFATAPVAELRMDRHEIRLTTGDRTQVVPTGPQPLQQVADLLAGLPVAGWRAYGWAAFELSYLLHGRPAAAGDRTLLHLFVPEHEVQIDAADGRAWLTGTAGAAADALAAAVTARPAQWPAPGPELDVTGVGAERFRSAVAETVAEIRAGALQKVILSRVVPVPDTVDLPATYVAGRRGNSPARSFLLDLGGLSAVGFSPETVVEVGPGGQVSTQPLAGTRRLTGVAEEDHARRTELRVDPKEIFEHAISVQLAQDELRGVCVPGTVVVEGLMDIKERGSVQHLASRVHGTLTADRNAWHALAALFPAVTASGIPKAEALDVIARHDGHRGLYSGVVLTVDAAGAMDAALVLRTLFVEDGRTWLRAGAGIIAMSTPERELEETREKFQSMSRFIVPAAPTTTPAGEPDPGLDELRRIAAELTEEDPDDIGADDNLFELGLESIALMRLVQRWRQDGIEVNFAELAERPTLNGWAELLRSRRPAGPAPTAEAHPVAGSAGDPFPLAVLQHAYWVGRGTGQRLGGVAAHLYTEFDGADVRPDDLRRAVERLVDRHDMLRVVITDNGEQRIARTSGWRGLTVHDLRDLTDDERTARLDAIRDANSHQMLDIERGEVFSTALSLLRGGRTRLHVDVDMVAADAVSYRILLADLARCYARPDEHRPAPGYTFQRYRAEARPTQDAAAAWWRDRLPTLPGAPALPLVTRPDAAASTRVARRAILLPAAERQALAEAARAHGITVAMAVATAFAETIGGWSAEPRFLLNVPLFGREPLHPAVGDIVGDFTSSVLLEVDLSRPADFLSRARTVQGRLHADAAHAAYTGVEVLRDLTRARGEQVLAPVVFTSALNLGELFDETVTTQFGTPVWIISQGPQVLLDAQVTELGGGLLVNWDTRDEHFADGVVDAMFAAFAALVRCLATDPAAWQQPVAQLLPAEVARRRAAANATDAPRGRRLLHDGFFANDTPAAPAILGPGTVTYGQLRDRALRVAAALAARGVRPGDPVGICLPKGPDQVVAVLGVLAAGGVYVPVGVEQPPARAERIAALAGYRLVLADTTARRAGAPVLLLADAEAADPLDAPVSVDEEDLAYLLFTSGSTGEPKGVEVPHRAAMNTIEDLIDRFGLGPHDRTLAISALDFDLSVFDLFAPLSVGGAVVTVTEDRRDVHAWGALVAAHRVTVLNCVPPLLDMLLAGGVALGPTLRLVLLGGDWVGADLPARLAAATPGCRFVALGGTTETAIHSTVCEVTGPVPDDWRSVPYGTPLRNVRCRVVDPLGRDCPDFVPGELWIGGDGVACGYRGDPERTADRFVEHAGRRWYRTGDLARYHGDATIEFLGRRDHQVKLRGYRIELGEIDAALAADPAVQAASTVVTGGRPGVLAAAAVLDGGPPAAEQVRRRLADALPAHMIPERIVAVAALPLTANGKIDRAAVRVLVEEAVAAESRDDAARAPASDLERVVELAWRDVLGTDGVSTTADFFAVGGDSVLAVNVVARLRDLLDTDTVSVRSLFAAPTVAGLAAELSRTQQQPGRLEAVAEVVLQIAAMSDDDVITRLGDGLPEVRG
ncbi:salicylate synthase [Dactylosporangium sp. AC04546]|uniref:salicylate synthase n=1 Tax=Dactylosporangium sp. AC04546 TaxID=2862460 RepID=UPI001EDF4624|nr:salicylate synthase [Dactylosporangium sp. AC04546]WVK88946.1 salicylate synthase [Dactylosporangium sp. AC04546]